MAKNNEFSARVKDIVRCIKRGSTLSYKEVATRAGNPKASRAVAMIMSKNHDVSIPCHRVICSNGGVGGYNGVRKPIGLSHESATDANLTDLKKKLLYEEGVIFK